MPECTKHKFSKAEAQTALNILLHKGTFKDGYGRIYHCGFCNSWHLTSQPLHKHLSGDPMSKTNELSLQHEQEWLELLNNSNA